jgi:hypothetical protein
MTTTTPAAAFAAVVARLAPNADEAQHMVQHGGPAAVTVGKAVLAALKAGKDDSEAGCKAFLAPLAPAADEARDLARHGNDRQQQVSKALLAAQAGAAAVDWHVAPPPEQPVSIADGFGDVHAIGRRPDRRPRSSSSARAPRTWRRPAAGRLTGPGRSGWRGRPARSFRGRRGRRRGPARSFAPAPGMATAEEVVVAIVRRPFVGTKAGAGRR